MSEVNRWLWCQRGLDSVIGNNDINNEIEDVMKEVLCEVGYNLFCGHHINANDEIINYAIKNTVLDMFYFVAKNPKYIYKRNGGTTLVFEELGYNNGDFKGFIEDLINNCFKVIKVHSDNRVDKILECVEAMKNNKNYSNHSKKIVYETMELIAYKLCEDKTIDKIIEDEAKFVLNMEWYDGLLDFYFEGSSSDVVPSHIYECSVEKLVKIIKEELNFLFGK